jgi:hypothetical protein
MPQKSRVSAEGRSRLRVTSTRRKENAVLGMPGGRKGRAARKGRKAEKAWGRRARRKAQTTRTERRVA